jgi:hypothetical protein
MSGRSWDDLLQGGLLAALACDTSTTLYHLSLHHLGSPSLALMASLLSLMPSSPVTLRFGAYSEPFFTYLSYKGEYHLLLTLFHFDEKPIRDVILRKVSVVYCIHPIRPCQCLPIQWNSVERVHPLGSCDPAHTRRKESTSDVHFLHEHVVYRSVT